MRLHMKNCETANQLSVHSKMIEGVQGCIIPLGVLPLKHRDQPKATAIAPEWYRVRVLPRWRSKPLCSSHKGSWCFCWKSNFEVPHGPENSFNINQTFLALQMSVISSQTKPKRQPENDGCAKKRGLLLIIEGHIRVISSWHFCWMNTPPPRKQNAALPKGRCKTNGKAGEHALSKWSRRWERFFDSPGEIKTHGWSGFFRLFHPYCFQCL